MAQLAKLPAAPQTPSQTGVFDQLLSDIVGGRYSAGAHLPAERDLARALGASRPTLREALRRLGEWGLVQPRRGSGVVVRDISSWSIDVLPAYLRSGASQTGLLATLRDLLELRRVVFLDILRLVATRANPALLAPARAAATRAWNARADFREFIQEDFELVRAIAMSGQYLPAVWLLNGLARVYFDLARTINGAATIPDDYLAAYELILDALAAHDAQRATEEMGRYLENHDRRLLAALEGLS